MLRKNVESVATKDKFYLLILYLSILISDFIRVSYFECKLIPQWRVVPIPLT